VAFPNQAANVNGKNSDFQIQNTRFLSYPYGVKKMKILFLNDSDRNGLLQRRTNLLFEESF